MTKLHSKPAFVTLITNSVQENLDLVSRLCQRFGPLAYFSITLQPTAIN